MAKKPVSLLKKEDIDKVNLMALSDEAKERVIALKDSIDINSSQSLLTFGVEASKNLSSFSSSILERVKMGDNPEAQELIMSFLGEVGKIDTKSLMPAKKGFFQKFFKTDEFERIISKHETLAQTLSKIAQRLDETRFQLLKDIEACEQFIARNREYIGELDHHILAVGLKMQELDEEISEMELSLDSQDQDQVNNLNELKNVYDALDRKLYDFNVMRNVALQNIPQLQLIKGGDNILAEKIQNSIITVIPMWENQFVIALNTLRSKNAAAVQREFADTTNKLMIQNSKAIREGSVAVARELERGIVEIDTLKQTNDNLIATLDELNTISEEGRKKRTEARQQLSEINTKLTETFLRLPKGKNGSSVTEKVSLLGKGDSAE